MSRLPQVLVNIPKDFTKTRGYWIVATIPDYGLRYPQQVVEELYDLGIVNLYRKDFFPYHMLDYDDALEFAIRIIEAGGLNVKVIRADKANIDRILISRQKLKSKVIYDDLMDEWWVKDPVPK